ncbi:MAG: pyridoxal-phosphate dependent enzyme [Myxococcota bacterium]
MEPKAYAERALVRRFPDLGERIPWVHLCDLPTSVTRVEKLEAEAGTGPLFVKHDDRTATLYGGNKARKLEWLLGHARARGLERVVTFGGLGTNHGLATALYSGCLGLACDLVLVDQPVDEKVLRRIRELVAAGATLHYGRTVAGAAILALGILARHPRSAIIPTGGSSPRGALGFVDAGLELAEQVGQGDLPEPERVYLALGTGGSAAGLALGLALGGLRTRVVGVLVTDLLPPDTRALHRLARRTGRLLARAGAPIGPLELDLEIEVGYAGPGYGHRTLRGGTAIDLAERLEELRLDGTYTGKALGALLRRERDQSSVVLFWNTLAAGVPELPLPGVEALPHRLRRLFPEP